jgi:hypothetical protein
MSAPANVSVRSRMSWAARARVVPLATSIHPTRFPARNQVEVREPGQGVQRDHRRQVEAGRGFRQGPDYRPSTVPNRELDETATTNGGSSPNGW